jgi:hypothetical protein
MVCEEERGRALRRLSFLVFVCGGMYKGQMPTQTSSAVVSFMKRKEKAPSCVTAETTIPSPAYLRSGVLDVYHQGELSSIHRRVFLTTVGSSTII